MKLSFLMIILTMLESGDMSAAFVNTDSLDECERRAKAVSTILAGQKLPIKDLVCRRSEATFEPFSHSGENAGAYRYIVTFDEREAWVTPRGADAACDGEGASARAPPEPVRFCVSSAQKLLSEQN